MTLYKIFQSIANFFKPINEELRNKIMTLTDDKQNMLNTVIDHFEKLDWKFVVLESEEFKNLLAEYEKLYDQNSPYKRKVKSSIRKTTPEEQKQISNTLKDLGITDFDSIDIESLYYDDEDPMMDMEVSMPIPASGVQFHQSEHDLPGMPDSVYNYAVIYLYGSKKNNLATLFSIDGEERLFVHMQKRYLINTYTDVIEMCDALSKEFNLDKIFFVATDISKKLLPYVIKGIESDIPIETVRQSIDLFSRFNEIVQIMSTGNLFVNNGPWLNDLQMDISRFMMYHQKKYSTSIGDHYPLLKSFAYGVDLWEKNSGTDYFTRNFGILDEKK